MSGKLWWRCAVCGFHIAPSEQLCPVCHIKERDQGWEVAMRLAEEAVRNPPLEHRFEVLERLHGENQERGAHVDISFRFLRERIERLELQEARIESLERWRRCKYGSYLATGEDVQEWSGRRPGEDIVVLAKGEALTNYLKVQAAGFHWRFTEKPGAPGPWFAAIRAHQDRWTFANALGNSLEAAILMCFGQAAKVFPGLHGISYDRDTKIQMITVPTESEE